MEKILIGKLVNTHGLRGEVKIMSESDFKDERFKKGSKLFLGELEVTVKSHRTHKNFDLVVFEEFNNINLVEKYKGTEIFVDKSLLSELEEDEFYYHELEGLEAFDGDELIGTIVEVRDMPSSTMLIVKMKTKRVYIPFVDEFIGEVDLEAGTIQINVIEGLL
jgi:16S rRNA processing protein RimM